MSREGEDALWQQVFTAQPARRREFEPSSKRRKRRPGSWPPKYVIIDATIMRAHQHAAGAKGDSSSSDRPLARGLEPKLHLAVDALGNPVRLRLTPGQTHEATQAEALIEGVKAASVIADTAHDAVANRARVAAHDSTAELLSKPSRSKTIAHDKHLYKERHLVECFFAKINQFRRIATRYEKTARNFLAMVTIACTVIWLR